MDAGGHAVSVQDPTVLIPGIAVEEKVFAIVWLEPWPQGECGQINLPTQNTESIPAQTPPPRSIDAPRPTRIG